MRAKEKSRLLVFSWRLKFECEPPRTTARWLNLHSALFWGESCEIERFIW